MSTSSGTVSVSSWQGQQLWKAAQVGSWEEPLSWGDTTIRGSLMHMGCRLLQRSVRRWALALLTSCRNEVVAEIHHENWPDSSGSWCKLQLLRQRPQITPGLRGDPAGRAEQKDSLRGDKLCMCLVTFISLQSSEGVKELTSTTKNWSDDANLNLYWHYSMYGQC